jgi:hypothetical protein
LVANCSASPQEIQLIYHTNFGKPLLDADAEAVIPAKSITPMNECAAAGLKSWSKFEGPRAEFIEQVYLMELFGNPANETCVMLKNPQADHAVTVEWSLNELPYFTLWKNLAAETDGYVVGFEPGTGFPFTRKTERLRGRVPALNPMEERRFRLTFALHRTSAQVAHQEACIRSLIAHAQ